MYSMKNNIKYISVNVLRIDTANCRWIINIKFSFLSTNKKGIKSDKIYSCTQNNNTTKTRLCSKNIFKYICMHIGVVKIYYVLKNLI